MFVKYFARPGAVLAALALTAASVFAPQQAVAQERVVVTGQIKWGVWVDPDGCMHWWSDGGLEGYMVNRLHPKTGRPYCLRVQTCLSADPSVYFATDSARLTAQGRAKLEQFFRSDNSFSYGVYGNADRRASDAYNIGLSKRRAAAVAKVARSVGSVVERVEANGERRPVSSKLAPNRRVDVVCYRLPE